ncbi:MAG: 2TM domain-containing protein [Promethearchaeota archaeon]
MANIEENREDKDIGEFNDESLRKIAKEIVFKRMGVKIHIIIYILVNILLIAINLLLNPSYLWCLWALFGWGIFMSYHVVSYIIYRRGMFPETATKLAFYHVYTYIMASAFLIFINYFTMNPSNPIFWFYWAVVPWGIGVLIHIVLWRKMRPKTPGEKKKKYLDRLVDKELERAKINKKE